MSNPLLVDVLCSSQHGLGINLSGNNRGLNHSQFSTGENVDPNLDAFQNLRDLKTIIKDNIDILVLSETKLDDSFPENQFIIEGFSKPYRLDRTKRGGGVMIYVREDIPSKKLNKHTFPEDIEGIFLELNFKKSKWLLLGAYHPPSQNDDFFFDSISNAMDLYLGQYDNFLLAGDFNAQDNEPCLRSFLDKYDACNIVKEPTCFKNINNPSCIDLFLTNKSKSFQHTKTVSCGLSDFHKLSATVLKLKFTKQKAKVIHYRDYSNFDNEHFKNCLKNCLNLCTSYDSFENKFLQILNIHAPLKQKSVRANEAPYMSRVLRKAIMKRSQLESKYFKSKTEIDKLNYKSQKNFVSRLYKKERKNFFQKLDVKHFLDNKKFWKNTKCFFSEKGANSTKITIVSGNEIISDDLDVANAFKNFFDNAVKSLNLPENSDILVEHNIEDSSDPIDIIVKKVFLPPKHFKN